MTSFFVAGIPKAMSVGQTIRFRRGAAVLTHQVRRNTSWAELVGYHAQRAAPARPYGGPVRVDFVFHLPRPKAAKRRACPVTRPDLDNLVHKLTDRFNGVLWRDDSQVVAMTLAKTYADDGRCGLAVEVSEIAP